jgi:acetyltransferase-like isoleucine patch superfamily enzyme
MIQGEDQERVPHNSRTAEHIRFVAPLSATEIVELAQRMRGSRGLEVRLGEKTLTQVIGVSDGRYPADATLCFVDRTLTQDTIDCLQGALVVTNTALAPRLHGCSMLVVPDARALFIDLLAQFEEAPGFSCFTTLIRTPPGVDPTAEVHREAVIEEDVCIGAGVRIAAGCVIKRGTAIGCGVLIQENTVIGGHGIALYKSQDGRVLRFPDLAGVIIEDNVEIGASCALPRGVLTSTFVGRDSVIGNLCNLGHAAKIGASVWMSVGTLIGGNSSIGAGSTLGLGTVVRDNVHIGCNCSVGMGSVVMRHLPDGSSVLGNPARRLPKINAGPER